MSNQFFSWLTTRAAEYDKNRAAAVRAQATRWKQVFAKQNNGDLPTESECDGVVRFHAPYDGYIHVWVKGDEEYEATYLGGQYLPYDSDNESLGSFGFDSATMIWSVPSERAVKFEEEFKATGITAIHVRVTGEYRDKHTDDLVRMVEISHCPKDVIARITDYLMGDIYRLQAIAAEKEQAEKDARDNAHKNGEDVAEGRQVITGVVLGMKWKESQYGSTLKMLVQDDRGFRVWGTVPSSLADADLNREDRIQFTGTVEQSHDDSKFGFFKRPSKAAIIEVASNG